MLFINQSIISIIQKRYKHLRIASSFFNTSLNWRYSSTDVSGNSGIKSAVISFASSFLGNFFLKMARSIYWSFLLFLAASCFISVLNCWKSSCNVFIFLFKKSKTEEIICFTFIYTYIMTWLWHYTYYTLYIYYDIKYFMFLLIVTDYVSILILSISGW